MSTEAEPKTVARVDVKLKKMLIQNRKEKQPGDTIEVTPNQKKTLTESGHI